MKAPKTASWAVEQGYKNVYLYQEGIKGWKMKGNKLLRQEPIPNMPIDVLKPDKAMAMIGKDPSIVVLDIRDFDLYDKMRIKVPNLVHIRAIDLLDHLDKLSKEKPIVVIDHAAVQCRIISPYLKSKGYKVLGYVDGGAMNWAKAGQPFDMIKK